MNIITAIDDKDLYSEIKSIFNKYKIFEDISYYEGIIEYINSFSNIDILILSEKVINKEYIKKLINFVKNKNLLIEFIIILKEDEISFREFILSYGISSIYILNKDKKIVLFNGILNTIKKIQLNNAKYSNYVEIIQKRLIQYNNYNSNFISKNNLNQKRLISNKFNSNETKENINKRFHKNSFNICSIFKNFNFFNIFKFLKRKSTNNLNKENKENKNNKNNINEFPNIVSINNKNILIDQKCTYLKSIYDQLYSINTSIKEIEKTFKIYIPNKT